MKIILALAAVFCCHIAFADATADQVFEQGKADAKTQAKNAKTLVNSASLSAVPESDKGVDTSQYSGKTPSQLGGMGVDKVSMCTNNPPTDKYGATECKAILDARGNKAKRPVFNIDPTTDPTIIAGNKINQDPYSVVGKSTTQASACVERKEYTPSKVETFTCSEYVLPTTKTCQKSLIVSVVTETKTIEPVVDVQNIGGSTSKVGEAEFYIDETDDIQSISLEFGGDNVAAAFLNNQPNNDVIEEEVCHWEIDEGSGYLSCTGDSRPKWLVDGTPRLKYLECQGSACKKYTSSLSNTLPLNRGKTPNKLYAAGYNWDGPGWAYAKLTIVVAKKSISESWENQCEFIN